MRTELEIIKRKTNRPVKPYETPKKRLKQILRDHSYHSSENSNTVSKVKDNGVADNKLKKKIQFKDELDQN